MHGTGRDIRVSYQGLAPGSPGADDRLKAAPHAFRRGFGVLFPEFEIRPGRQPFAIKIESCGRSRGKTSASIERVNSGWASG